jgi:pimeloyl-ACP methyl ester carboxylesterase
VAAAAGPAVAGALAGAGPARSWRLAALPGYTFESLATAVAGIIRGARTVVLGHSLGGVAGLALAGRGFAVSVQAVIGLGIKIVQTGQELDRAVAAAHRPPAWFASRDEAAARYLRTSDLAGLLAAAGPVVDAGLREQHERWRLAMDPCAFAAGSLTCRDCWPGARPR